MMNSEDKILHILEQIQGDMKLVKTRLDEHGEILGSLNVVSEFDKAGIDNLTHQSVNIAAELKSQIEETNSKIDTIAKELNFIEIATGKNITDIAYLKGAK